MFDKWKVENPMALIASYLFVAVGVVGLMAESFGVVKERAIYQDVILKDGMAGLGKIHPKDVSQLVLDVSLAVASFASRSSASSSA